jgi:DNA-binding CsgD family transcriptional regulator
MLLGREQECGRIDRLLARALSGTSGVLLIRGEAGIGKSALLRYAVERGVALRLLTAQGIESESELPFSGLFELLRPAVPELERIPEAQGASLRSALALGPPAAGDRFTIAAATLSLLAAAAEARPLLAVIDDAHWLDASSGEALLFAARRLDAEGIVLLLAVREGEESPFDAGGLPELRLSGLDRQSSASLLESEAVRTAAPATVEMLFRATRGNPLALIEMSALLTESQLSGREPLADPLPAGAGIEQAFLRRVRELPSESQKALLVAAASQSSEMDEVAGATRRLGVDAAALGPAESAGLVSIKGRRLEWRHPLLRSAVYHAGSAAERRAVHQALAETTGGEQRAWYLAAAALAPDEAIAAALERAGVDARARRGHAAAVRAFERAAELTPGADERARRLLEAARDSHVLGSSKRALELVDAALASANDPVLRADVRLMRGRALIWSRGPSAAHENLLVAAAETESIDRARAAIMLVEAALACTMTGDVTSTLETAERAQELAHRAGSEAEAYATALLGNALILCGRTEEGYPLLVQTRLIFEAGDPLAGAPLIHAAGHGSIWMEDYSEARHVLERVIEAAREASAGGLLSFPLACLSELDFRTGRWAAAYAGASEALRLAEEAGQPSQTAFSLVCLARIEAARGLVEKCRTHVARARELAEVLGAGSILTYAGSALGLLELSRARPEKAIPELEHVARLVEAHGLGNPAVVQWAPDLVEAYARVGHHEEARKALARFDDQAESTGRTWALGAAARARGLLADEDSFEEHFEAALHWHDYTPTPFERARTELAFGERLRRAKRPADARFPLRSALEAFERLGAAPWAEHARTELAATGERERRPRPSRLEQLTPQELQIALLVADGATNREAATALFLSPKTVEYHLGKTYQKLGVRSRTELAGMLVRESRSLQSA